MNITNSKGKKKKGIKTTHTAVTREATEGNKDIESKLIYSNKYLI